MPSAQTDLVALARELEADGPTAARALRLLDLTSLAEDETPAAIETLCRRAVQHRAAAVCLYPRWLPLARGLLAGSVVRLATVAAFPAGGDDIEAAATECAAAVGAGADEVDVVAPLQALAAGDVEAVAELVQACRAATGPATTLKLILETGVLAGPAAITAAARTAVMAGVDFLKTSTGKVAAGATLETAALLLEVVAEAGGRVGLKLAGGVRTADDAARYLGLADAMMGAAWVTSERFRLGASALLDDLLRVRDSAQAADPTR